MKPPLSAFIACFTFFLHPAYADDDFTKVEFKATPITHSIQMLEGAGGNITALVGAEGTFLVDDDFAPMAGKLLAKLNELNGGSPRFIVNTHFHYDHTGGNEIFGPTATIIAATAVRDRLMKEQTLWREQHPPVPEQALPTITFEQTIVLHLNGEDIRIVHFPHGHTDGDSVVFFPQSKVVSMGDLYFSGMYPIFHPEHAGSISGYAKNIAAVIRQIPSDCKIVPGHGPLSGKTELVKYHSMILASIATVKEGIRKGRTLAQIQKAGLASEWRPFSHGYLTSNQWIALLFKNLQQFQAPRNGKS